MKLERELTVCERPDLVNLAIAREIPSPEDKCNAIQDLRVGNHHVLSACAKLIHESVSERCEFSESKGWDHQLPLLECLMERFFRDGDAAFGGFEILKERRKATKRVTPESGATLTQAPAELECLATFDGLGSRSVDIGGIVKIPGKLLRRMTYRHEERADGTFFTRTRVPRTLKESVARVWSEWWYSLVQPADDVSMVAGGGIPAQEAFVSDGLVTTPIISLFRYAPGRFWAGTFVDIVCFEVNPLTAEITDIRGMSQGLGSSMTASPHAHKALLKTLERCS